jgi:hypothetical protein
MANTLSSKEHVIACLTRLQAVTEIYWRGEEAAKLALAVFIDELVKHDPRVVRFACEQWGRKNRKFPYLAQLLEYIQHNAEEPAVPALTGPEAAGSIARTEVILLLGAFVTTEAKTRIGDHTRAYREFIAEAARLWSKVRPEGGLGDLAQTNLMRRVVGFALEAWARGYLGLSALHVDYATDGVRRMHREMTGDDLLTRGVPCDLPFPGAGKAAAGAASRLAQGAVA